MRPDDTTSPITVLLTPQERWTRAEERWKRQQRQQRQQRRVARRRAPCRPRRRSTRSRLRSRTRTSHAPSGSAGRRRPRWESTRYSTPRCMPSAKP